MSFFDKFKNKKNEPNAELDKGQISNKILDDIYTCFSGYHTEKDETSVTLKDINVTVKPFIVSADTNMVTTGYYLSSDSWDRSIFEICSGLGKDTSSALGMAQGSFMFALMDCVIKLRTKQEYVPFESEFNGSTHKWKAYIGNILGMGDNIKNSTDTYWDALKEHIAKRLGNQKICYVKIFASNSGTGDPVGECRINNLKSDELSRIVEDIAQNFECSNFTSQKQFFIFEQEDETREEYPYTEKDIIEYTKTAVQLFELCIARNKLEVFLPNLESVIGDKNLAEEIFKFVPEICAENTLSQFTYPETLIFGIGDETFTCYKTQLYSYSIIYDALYDIISDKFLKDPENVRKSLVCTSSVFDVSQQLILKGYKFEHLKSLKLSITYNMNDGYVPR